MRVSAPNSSGYPVPGFGCGQTNSHQRGSGAGKCTSTPRKVSALSPRMSSRPTVFLWRSWWRLLCRVGISWLDPAARVGRPGPHRRPGRGSSCQAPLLAGPRRRGSELARPTAAALLLIATSSIGYPSTSHEQLPGPRRPLCAGLAIAGSLLPSACRPAWRSVCVGAGHLPPVVSVGSR